MTALHPHFTVGKGVLLPRNDDARQVLSSCEVGSDIEVDVLDPDDGYLRRKIFWIIGELAKWKAIPREEMRTQMLVTLGRCRVIRLANGNRALVVQSMDRRAMKGPELELLWRDLMGWLTDNTMKFPIDLALQLSEMIARERPAIPEPPENEPW
jgi:hypothetical protein